MTKIDVKCEDSINIRASNINSSLEKFIKFHFHNRMSVKLELVGGGQDGVGTGANVYFMPHEGGG